MAFTCSRRKVLKCSDEHDPVGLPKRHVISRRNELAPSHSTAPFALIVQVKTAGMTEVTLRLPSDGELHLSLRSSQDPAASGRRHLVQKGVAFGNSRGRRECTLVVNTHLERDGVPF